MFETSSIGNFTSSQTANIAKQNDMGKEEFLQLLVAQLQNQDPLSPMESQEFAVQLAQFSSVEQLSNIDSNLQDGMNIDLLLTQAVSNSLAANFIGKQVTAYGNSVSLVNDEVAQLNFKLDDYAEKVNINILDASGTVVRTIETKGLSSGTHDIEWDGNDKEGNRLPEGVYHFEIEAEDAEGNMVMATEHAKGFVSAVRYIDGSAILVINGEEISLADVMEIG